MDLIYELSLVLGFKYEIKLCKDKKVTAILQPNANVFNEHHNITRQYGSQNPDGTWNGMLGELIRNEADIAIVDLTITKKREEAVDFTLPFMTTGVSILFTK